MAQFFWGLCLRASLILSTHSPWTYFWGRGKFAVLYRRRGIAYLVVTVREIKSCDVHAAVEELDEHVDIPA